MVEAKHDKKLVLQKQWFIDSHSGNIKDKYHFCQRLGSGGFGVVYLAEERKTGKELSEMCRDQICGQGNIEKQSQRLRNILE